VLFAALPRGEAVHTGTRAPYLVLKKGPLDTMIGKPVSVLYDVVMHSTYYKIMSCSSNEQVSTLSCFDFF